MASAPRRSAPRRPGPAHRTSGCRGPTPTRSDGSATHSINARSPTSICATKTFAPEICGQVDVLLYGHVDLELAEQIQGLPRTWGPMPFKKTRANPQFRYARRIRRHHRRNRFGRARADPAVRRTTAACWSRWAAEPCSRWRAVWSAVVRRASGGAPRSRSRRRRGSPPQPRRHATRTPGAHVRVTFDRPDHPIAYGYPAAHLRLPPEFPALHGAAPLAAHGLLHDLPRRSRRPQQL